MIQVTTRGPFTLPGSSSHYPNHLVLYQSRRIRTRGWQFESPEGGSRSAYRKLPRESNPVPTLRPDVEWIDPESGSHGVFGGAYFAFNLEVWILIVVAASDGVVVGFES